MIVHAERVIAPGFMSGVREMIAVVLQELRQEAVALPGRHTLVEQHVAERRRFRERGRKVRIARGQFLGDDARGQGVRARAAALFRERERAQAQLRGRLEQLHGKAPVECLQALRLQAHRLDLPLDEIPNSVADFELLGAQTKVVHVATLP